MPYVSPAPMMQAIHCPRQRTTAARLVHRPLTSQSFGRGPIDRTRVSFPPLVQAKLRIGAQNDKFEQKADSVADKVMRMPEPGHGIASGGDYDSHGGMHFPAEEPAHVAHQFGPGERLASPVHIVMQAPNLIQRAVSYGGSNIRRDIDFFDPATAPAGNAFGTGITEIAVNGTVVAWKEAEPNELQGRFFPLPSYVKSGSDCVRAEGEINVNVTDQIRVLKNPPWTSTVRHGDLASFWRQTCARAWLRRWERPGDLRRKADAGRVPGMAH